MKFAIKTFGCKVNQYESEKIRESIESAGFGFTKNLEDADTILINTCAVTETALTKMRRVVGTIRRQSSEKKIALIGCGVDYFKNNNHQFLQEVDAVVGNSNKFDIINLLTSLHLKFDGNISVVNEIVEFKGHSRAFVKIQDGCDNYCSYCIIPYLRTELISRPDCEIINEIEQLVNSGYSEIVLTGINIQKYDYHNSATVLCHTTNAHLQTILYSVW